MNIKKVYSDNGFIIIRNLIKEKYISEVINSLEMFKNRNSYYFTQNNHNWVKSGEITKEGYLINSIQSPTKQKNCGSLKFSIEEILASTEISKILQEINGSEIFVNWQNMLFDKSTGTIDHADTWYLDTKPRGQMIATWIALEDINESAGRFFVYPKSHKLNIAENFNQKIKSNLDYVNFINQYLTTKKLQRYAPEMKKGDVLFWHPFTIHGSLSQKNPKYSRKSLTAHYHPLGAGRIETAESKKEIDRYIKKLRKSKNPCIFFDNCDPSDFQFTTISYSKWLIKKLIRKKFMSKSSFMNREEIFKKESNF